MTREIPLSRGLVALVDDEDYERVMAAGPWHAVIAPRTHYAARKVQSGGRRIQLFLHVFLTDWSMTDHRNGDGLDNRRANLRPATAAENSRNRRPNRNNTSGFKGVFTDRRHTAIAHPWRAVISLDGRRTYLGSYATATEAAHAYDAAARMHYGEFAWLNFPDHDREAARP